MRKITVTNNGVKSQEDCLTTTEFARICGVSRFTIINWTKHDKIKAIKTVGGQYRISLSEAISFFESMHRQVHHNEKNDGNSDSLIHCWEYSQKTNCDKKCKECRIYGKEIDCFVVVQQFGKGVIRCKGDCSHCAYFKEFFHFYSKRTRPEESQNKQSKPVATGPAIDEKKGLLYNLIYGVGHGVHEVKDTVVDIKEIFAGKRSRTKQVEKAND